MRTLIKNGLIIDPKAQREGRYDILIEEGKIVEIGNDI